MAPSPFPTDVPLNVKKAVLYGLLGFAGDVIVADATGFRLHDAVPVQPAERMVIDTLVQSGHALRSLEAFVQQDGSHWQAFQRAARGQASLYLVRVCDGLREVLGAYRRAVADLDWELDQNPVLPVAYFQSRLGEHLMLLGELGALCSRVMQSQLQGAPLLNELRARTQSGVPVVRGIMTRLLRYGFDLMVQHIAFWMLYGVLPDSHGEFFIVRRRPPGEDPPPQGDDDEVDASGDHTGVFEEYQLDQSLVPDVLLERSEYHKVPAAILFVGKATRILQVAERRAAHRSLTGDASGRLTVHGPTEEEREGMLAELEAANGDTFDVHRLQVAVHGIHGRVGRHLWTLLTEETRLSEHLRALRDYFLCCRGDFFAPFLELSADVLLVDIRRDEAAFQLQQHWHTACLLSSADDDECFDRITLRWQPTAQGPLAADSTRAEGARPQAIGGPGGTHNDGPAQRAAATRKQIFNAWKGLSLDYEMQWPLSLLLTPPVMLLYNKLFQFLTMVLRIKAGLHRMCKKLALYSRLFTTKRRDPDWRPAIGLWEKKLNAIVFLRQRMAHFLDTLAYYLQVDVLEAQYGALTKAMATVEDFEGASQAHERYISALIDGCFLDHHLICDSLEELFMHCASLVTFVHEQLPWPSLEPVVLLPGPPPRAHEPEPGWARGVDAAMQLNRLDMTPVLGLETDFDRRFKLLFNLLTAKKHHAVLAGLLLRLDYNGSATRTDFPALP